MLLALLASALFASSASAKTPPTKTAYLALGDSISFGYKASTEKANDAANTAACEAAASASAKKETEKLLTEGAKCNPAGSYEPGFVGDFAKTLAKTEKKAGHELETLNISCPGETSEGLIGNGPLGTGIEELRASKSESPLSVNAPCAYHNLAGSPLHTEIGFGSELEAAGAILKGPATVTAVTLQIGSNDELHAVAFCENPAYDYEHGFGSLIACIENEVGPKSIQYPGEGVFVHILVNIGVSIGVLREEGYKGTIVVLGFYNPEAIVLPGSDALDKALNEGLEGEVASNAYGAGVKVAQPFPVFNPSATKYKMGETAKEHEKLEGAEIKALTKYTEYITHKDVHPTALGYKELGKLVAEAF